MIISEFSELQAVDFGIGAHVSAAFQGLADVGTKEWKEFLKRPANRQIYRHDSEGPQEFIHALMSARKAEKSVPTTGERVNAAELPVVYYFRKPGMTNSDNTKPNRGRYSWNDDQTKALEFMAMPLYLDYQLYLLAWDKPTLDKMQLAFYAWATLHDTFVCQYRIAGEVLDVKAYVQDHRTITFTDASQAQDGNRLYAVTMPISIYTQVLAGAEVMPPSIMRIEGGVP